MDAKPLAGRLEIELVPKTCWFSNVRDHVGAADWDALRKPVFAKAGRACEICGGRGPKWPVECHETWRYGDKSLTQTLEGLSALCPSCHQVKHIGLANLRGRGGAAEAHLAKVNGWTRAECGRHIRAAFETWAARSEHQWSLDLSWLEKVGIHVKPKR